MNRQQMQRPPRPIADWIGRSLLLAAFALLAAGCGGSGSTAFSSAPSGSVTVLVNNHSGESVSVGYSFARMPVAHLGGVNRGGQATFSFGWEPGPLEFATELPRGVMTSNRMSVAIGDTVLLEVRSRELRATKKDGST